MRRLELHAFLSARGLTSPNGQALYAYRCTGEEAASFGWDLREVLPGAVRARRVDSQTAQVFCLWAAEWWKSHHRGGSWRWEDLLRELGAEELAPGGGAYPLLCDVVRRGLTLWGRPLLRTAHGRAFLVTIACEGGLPLQLVQREQAGLRRYFRALLEEFRVYGAAGIPEHELAERVCDRLPRSLQQEVVYELSGRLVAQIWQMQKEIGDTRDPVADLDARHPGWRDDLPLLVSDNIARALLNGLLLDAASIARGGGTQIRWLRWLEQTDEEWTVAGELRLPATMEAGDFGALFGFGADSRAPARFDLCIRPDGGTAEIQALGTERGSGAGETRVRLETAPRATRAVRGEAATRGRSLIVRAPGAEVESRAFPGAEALSELPWVFVPTPEPGRYDLAGQGSVSVAAEEVFVAASPDALPEPHPDSTCEPLGPVTGAERVVYRVRGCLAIVDAEGTSVTIQTGAARSTIGIEYLLRGRRREIGREGTPVFVGVPTLLEQRDGGSMRQVPLRDLSWRADIRASRWEPLTERSVGDGRLRYVANGEVRHVVRTRILPAGAEIRFLPESTAREGTIEFSGFSADAVRFLGPEGVGFSVSGAAGTTRLRLAADGQPPPSIDVEAEWTGRGRLRLSLPFPSRGSGFRTPSGEPFGCNAAVPLGRLSGVRGIALIPQSHLEFFVEGAYRGDDPETRAGLARYFRTPMDEADIGHFELDLGRLHREVQARLSCSSDPDGCVRLDIQSNQVRDLPACPLRVRTFDLAFEVSDGSGVVTLATDDLPGLPESEAATICVEAYPLLHPSRDLIPLEHLGGLQWALPVESLEPGPWVLFGRQGDWYRVRPCIHVINGGDAAWEGASSLSGAYAYPAKPDTLHERLDAVVEALAADAGHPDWPALYGLVRWTRHVPASAFDLLRALARSADAAALAALRCAPADLELLWRALESLPFWWRLVPKLSWDEAAAQLVASVRAELARVSAPTDADLDRTALSDAVRRLVSYLPSLEPVFAFASSMIFRTDPPQTASAVRHPVIRQQLLADFRARLAAAPAFAPGRVPGVDHFGSLVHHLSAHPGASDLLVARQGRYDNDDRFAVSNAPTVAALVALTGHRLKPAQQMQLRGIADLDPDWFAHVYDIAYLYALGGSHAAALTAHGIDG